MGKLVIEDDCLAPRAYYQIVYKGPDPLKAYRAMKGILRRVFLVVTKDIWEREFRWMPDSDPAEFFIRVFVTKDMDRFTFVRAEVVLHGWQPLTPGKSGGMRIKIGGILRTELPEDTFIQKTPIYKALMWLYFHYFYFKVRREVFLKRCREWLSEVRDTVMDLLGLPKPMEEAHERGV